MVRDRIHSGLLALILALVGGLYVPPRNPGGSPAKPPVEKPIDPLAAIGKLSVGNSGCTAAAVLPRRPDGKWDVLTASHCTGGPGTRGTLLLKDGRRVSLVVQARDSRSDLTWFCTDQTDLVDLPYLKLAAADPPAGTHEDVARAVLVITSAGLVAAAIVVIALRA